MSPPASAPARDGDPRRGASRRHSGAPAWALAALGWAAPAGAHGLDANRVEVVLHEAVVEAVATPPAEFVRADDDGDGLLTVAEVRAHRDEVARTLLAALVVTDGDGRAGEVERSDVSVPRGEPGDEGRGREFLRLTVKLRWPRPPAAVSVRCGFVGAHPVTVIATRAESTSTPGVLTLLGGGEFGTLTSPAATVTLLRQRPAPAPPAAPAPPHPRPATVAALGALALLAAAFARSRRRAAPFAPAPPIGDP